MQPDSLPMVAPQTTARRHSPDFGDFPPCVIFEANPSLEVISISENVSELFGVNIEVVIGRPQFWRERVAAEDWSLFQEKLCELEKHGSVSFIHRIADGSGLPVWLVNSLRSVNRDSVTSIFGCLVPIYGETRILGLDQETVGRFIHKLGNHFQLLNLVVNSLKNSLPRSRESEVLQETLDKLIDLTRNFSDCNQSPSLTSKVQLLEVIKAAAEGHISGFAANGVQLQIDFKGIPDDAMIASDPYQLDTALDHILQNAGEATIATGTVEIGGRLITYGPRDVARLYIRDTGCGIPAREVNQVTLPFFSTKKGHDGLGLTMASRFIEMHGGALRIESREGAGTEVEILLPVERIRDKSCA
jgi:Histidine kinase-, DNA gyrase B-, and HSP90-like ATPase